MDRLKRNQSFIKRVTKASKRERCKILKNINDDEVKTLCDICHNIINQNIRVTPTQLKRLRKHKAIVRALGSRSSLRQKKRYLRQKGGFLAALLPLLGTVASTLIGAFAGR